MAWKRKCYRNDLVLQEFCRRMAVKGRYRHFFVQILNASLSIKQFCAAILWNHAKTRFVFFAEDLSYRFSKSDIFANFPPFNATFSP